MTSAERTELRQAIDAEKRRRINQARDRGQIEPACTGCGGPTENYTPGCRPCMYRKASRKRRADVKAGRATIQHGTTTAAKLGCNCRPCRDAINAYWRDRRRNAA